MKDETKGGRTVGGMVLAALFYAALYYFAGVGLCATGGGLEYLGYAAYGLSVVFGAMGALVVVAVLISGLAAKTGGGGK